MLASRHAIRADFGAGAVRGRGANPPAEKGRPQNSVQDARERGVLLLDSRPPFYLQRQPAMANVEGRHTPDSCDF